MDVHGSVEDALVDDLSQMVQVRTEDGAIGSASDMFDTDGFDSDDGFNLNAVEARVKAGGSVLHGKDDDASLPGRGRPATGLRRGRPQTMAGRPQTSVGARKASTVGEAVHPRSPSTGRPMTAAALRTSSARTSRPMTAATHRTSSARTSRPMTAAIALRTSSANVVEQSRPMPSLMVSAYRPHSPQLCQNILQPAGEPPTTGSSFSSGFTRNGWPARIPTSAKTRSTVLATDHEFLVVDATRGNLGNIEKTDGNNIVEHVRARSAAVQRPSTASSLRSNVVAQRPSTARMSSVSIGSKESDKGADTRQLINDLKQLDLKQTRQETHPTNVDHALDERKLPRRGMSAPLRPRVLSVPEKLNQRRPVEIDESLHARNGWGSRPPRMQSAAYRDGHDLATLSLADHGRPQSSAAHGRPSSAINGTQTRPFTSATYSRRRPTTAAAIFTHSPAAHTPDAHNSPTSSLSANPKLARYHQTNDGKLVEIHRQTARNNIDRLRQFHSVIFRRLHAVLVQNEVLCGAEHVALVRELERDRQDLSIEEEMALDRRVASVFGEKTGCMNVGELRAMVEATARANGRISTERVAAAGRWEEWHSAPVLPQRIRIKTTPVRPHAPRIPDELLLIIAEVDGDHAMVKGI